MHDGYVVIGSNFGDEGKGLITDHLARRFAKNNPLVVRFNGGSQAGHTVVDQESDSRHVFGSFSAGSFAGADTYLGARFIFNPGIMATELEKFSGQKPQIYVNPKAIVTTFYDMAINSLVELSRGRDKHGSCGMGINETVTRSAFDEFRITAEDLHYTMRVIDKLDAIHDVWVPRRLQELNLLDFLESRGHSGMVQGRIKMYKAILSLHTKVDHQVAARKMTNDALDNVSVVIPKLVPERVVIFEGAQGLRLDEHLGEFPHVTRSMTGLPYALLDAVDLGIKNITPVYVTRAYVTRHGAGPLEREGEDFGGEMLDMTNVHNQWQGTIRTAPLEIMTLRSYIREDMVRALVIAQALDITILPETLSITCLDQFEKNVTVYHGSVKYQIPREDFAEWVCDRITMNPFLVSYGATSSHVRNV